MLPPERLADLAPFRDVPQGVVAVLARHAVEVRFARGAVLFLAGSRPKGWFVVLDGTVRVIRGRGARQHVIHAEERGGTLGEVPLFEGGAYPATAIAATAVRCAVVPRDAVLDAIRAHPEVALLFLHRLARRARALVDRLDERSAQKVQARLIDWLLARRVAGDLVTLGMTQQALAEELGTVREVLSRELRGLVRRGWLEPLGKGRYRVADITSLRRAAQDG